jgi:hypothetical protein
MTSSPVCLLCGNQDSLAHFSQRGYDLRVCNHCIDPYPTGSEAVHKLV